MKGTELFSDCVHLMCYKCQKVSPNRDGAYVFDYAHLMYHKFYKINPNRSDWIKNKKATINPINKNDSKCFQYAVTVTLNYEEIGKHAEKIKTIKPFINIYKWKGINFPSEK